MCDYARIINFCVIIIIIVIIIKYIKHVIVLKIHNTHGHISSNLVLI